MNWVPSWKKNASFVQCILCFIFPKVILQKSEVESMVHSPGDYILLSADKYEIKVWSPLLICLSCCIWRVYRMEKTLSSLQVWPLGREINCKCLKTLSVSEDRSISLQPRLQFDGRSIVCSSDLGVYQWDFSSFEILRQVFNLLQVWQDLKVFLTSE